MPFRRAMKAGDLVYIYTHEGDKTGSSSYTVPATLTIEKIKYDFLGAGSSNVAYVSADKKLVYKESYGEAKDEIERLRKEKSPFVAVNDPERLVSILQSIDSNNKEKYRVISSGHVMPYYSPDKIFSKKEAKKIPLSEEQRITAVIDFFEITKGRILCDAFVEENLLLSGKQVRFPDVGDGFDFGVNENREPKSPTSYHAWYKEGNMRAAYQDLLKKIRSERKLPRLAATIEALITLKEKFPDLCESVAWLKDSRNDSLRDKLADLFESDKKLSEEEIKVLREEIIAVTKKNVVLPPRDYSRTTSGATAGVASGDEGSPGATSHATSHATSPARSSFTFWTRSPQPEKLTAEEQLSAELTKVLKGYLRSFPKPAEQKITHCKALINLAEGLKAPGDKAQALANFTFALANFTFALQNSISWNKMFEGSSNESNYDHLSSSFSFGRNKKVAKVKRFEACLQTCETLLPKPNKSPDAQPLSVLAANSQSPRAMVATALK